MDLVQFTWKLPPPPRPPKNGIFFFTIVLSFFSNFYIKATQLCAPHLFQIYLKVITFNSKHTFDTLPHQWLHLSLFAYKWSHFSSSHLPPGLVSSWTLSIHPPRKRPGLREFLMARFPLALEVRCQWTCKPPKPLWLTLEVRCQQSCKTFKPLMVIWYIQRLGVTIQPGWWHLLSGLPKHEEEAEIQEEVLKNLCDQFCLGGCGK